VLNKLIYLLFWSRAFEGVREAHRAMCYEMGKDDQEKELCYTYIDERYEH
jgi:hypothetical protein